MKFASLIMVATGLFVAALSILRPIELPMEYAIAGVIFAVAGCRGIASEPWPARFRRCGAKPK